MSFKLHHRQTEQTSNQLGADNTQNKKKLMPNTQPSNRNKPKTTMKAYKVYNIARQMRIRT